MPEGPVNTMCMVPANGIAPNADMWLLLAEEMHAEGTAGSNSGAITIAIAITMTIAIAITITIAIAIAIAITITIALMHAWTTHQ